MNTMPWTLPPFCSEQPPAHRATSSKPGEYECSCGEELIASTRASIAQVSRWHIDGSIGSEAARRFVQTYLLLADLAWRRAGRYFAAMATFDPELPVSLDGAKLMALDPFGAHFHWPDGRSANLPYEWLITEDFEAALAAWVEASDALTERSDFELPTLEAIEAARAVLERSRHLDAGQRSRRCYEAWLHLMASHRRSAAAAASGGLGLVLDSPEAALADIWHRSLYHDTPTGNHAAADLEAAARHLRDLIPPGWKLVHDDDAPSGG